MTFTAPQAGMLLRDAIKQAGISKRALTAIKFNGGTITVNGNEQNVRFILQADDEICVVFPQEQRSEGLIATHGKLAIIYEDDAIIVLNKPAGQSTIPSREHPTNSVANDLCGYFEQQQLASTAHIVTRLDRDTSGLMCVAKHAHIHHLMSEAQKNHAISRQYEALVTGHVTPGEQSIIAPIRRHPESIILREVGIGGQFAHTDVKVLRYAQAANKPITHIQLKLHTGRTHQIRVHLSYKGYPLLGDELYGGSRTTITRQALHCSELSFTHPITQQALHFKCAIMDDMQQILNKQ